MNVINSKVNSCWSSECQCELDDQSNCCWNMVICRFSKRWPSAILKLYK